MVLKYSQGGKINYSFSKYIAENEEDLPLLGSKCNFGDTVYVIHTSETWMLDSHHTWWPLNNTEKDSIACDCIEEMTIWKEIEE